MPTSKARAAVTLIVLGTAKLLRKGPLEECSLSLLLLCLPKPEVLTQY